MTFKFLQNSRFYPLQNGQVNFLLLIRVHRPIYVCIHRLYIRKNELLMHSFFCEWINTKEGGPRILPQENVDFQMAGNELSRLRVF